MVVLAALWSTCCLAQQAEAPKRKVVVGTRNLPPFAIKTDEDTWNGVSIALWRAIAEDLNYETEFRQYPDVTSLLAAVEKSEVDVGVAAITVTADREKHVDFSMPYYTSGIGVAVRKADKGNLGAALKSLVSPKIIAWIAPLAGLIVAIGVFAWFFERRHPCA